MKYFDLVANKVVIHSDALAIPAFSALWESNDDKSLVTNYIKYIVLNNHPLSKYVERYDADERKTKLMNELFGGAIEFTAEFKIAEDTFIDFLDTLPVRMLRGIRNNLESMASSLDKTKHNSDMSFRDMKDLLELSSKAEKAIRAIKDLEDEVRKDELDSSTVRGGGKIGYYEIPRQSR